MSFECKRCGRCCIHSIVQFEKHEYERISSIAAAKGIEFVCMTDRQGEFYVQKNAFNNLLEAMKRPQLSGELVLGCEFLEKDGNCFKCSIYDLRPQVCKDFGLGLRPETFCINPNNR